MRSTAVQLAVLLSLTGAFAGAQLASNAPPRGIVLADLTWQEAEGVLTPGAVIVIPLGAQSKEHGPHLRLDNDFQLAE